jgi:hypothetical protein
MKYLQTYENFKLVPVNEGDYSYGCVMAFFDLKIGAKY